VECVCAKNVGSICSERTKFARASARPPPGNLKVHELALAHLEGLRQPETGRASTVGRHPSRYAGPIALDEAVAYALEETD
jgi:hypothetical protein